MKGENMVVGIIAIGILLMMLGFVIGRLSLPQQAPEQNARAFFAELAAKCPTAPDEEPRARMLLLESEGVPQEEAARRAFRAWAGGQVIKAVAIWRETDPEQENAAKCEAAK